MYYDHIKGRTIEIVDATLQELGCSEDLRLRLAIEECVQNKVDYAYEDDGDLTITTEKGETAITITIIDGGKPFNPLQAEAPDLNAPLEEREVGGLGIFITTQIMDRLSYSYENGKNILTMVYKRPVETVAAKAPEQPEEKVKPAKRKKKEKRQFEAVEGHGSFTHRAFQIFFLPLALLLVVSMLAYGKFIFSKIEMNFFFRQMGDALERIMESYEEEGKEGAMDMVTRLPYQEINHTLVVNKNGECILQTDSIYEFTKHKLNILREANHYTSIYCEHHFYTVLSCYSPKYETYLVDYIPFRKAYVQYIWFFILVLLICSISIFVSIFFYKRTLGPRIRRVVMNDERMQTELDIAHDLQLGFVPNDFPQDEQIDMSGLLQPAREVGGDLYSYSIYAAEHKRLYFVIGDVSDKGVSAALMMAAAVCLFNQLADMGMPVQEIVKQMNAAVCRRNTCNMFCTLFVGCLDLSTLELSYINAGHNAPLLNREPIKVTPNLPIGLDNQFAYQEQHIKLKKNDMLVLYTDGVTEAKNNKNEFFGTQRMTESIPAEADAYTTTQSILNGALEFSGDAEQNDDITIFCIRVKK